MHKLTETLISVIIPVYNCEKYIVCSVRSVLEQMYKNFELIIIDDGSTDGTPVLVNYFLEDRRVSIYRQENLGTASARNLGIKYAKGDYFAFLDADDYWAPEKLLLQLECFSKKPEIGVNFGLVETFIEDGVIGFEIGEKNLRGLHAGCMLIRRRVMEKVGYFINSEVAEFLEWWTRFEALKIPYSVIDKVLMFRRIHGQNKTIELKEDLYKSYLNIARQNRNLS